MTGYQELISKATGRARLEDVLEIEECMREDLLPGVDFDRLTSEQLEQAARDALQILLDVGELQEIDA